MKAKNTLIYTCKTLLRILFRLVGNIFKLKRLNQTSLILEALLHMYLICLVSCESATKGESTNDSNVMFCGACTQAKMYVGDVL